MRVIFGSLVNGNPIISDPGAIANLIAADLGGTWTNLMLQDGEAALNDVPDSWSTSGYVLLADGDTGTQACYEVFYDPNTNELFRPVSATNGMGTGALDRCSGCTKCAVRFDSTLKVTGCYCITDGSCKLTVDIIV